MLDVLSKLTGRDVPLLRGTLFFRCTVLFSCCATSVSLSFQKWLCANILTVCMNWGRNPRMALRQGRWLPHFEHETRARKMIGMLCEFKRNPIYMMMNVVDRNDYSDISNGHSATSSTLCPVWLPPWSWRSVLSPRICTEAQPHSVTWGVIVTYSSVWMLKTVPWVERLF